MPYHHPPDPSPGERLRDLATICDNWPVMFANWRPKQLVTLWLDWPRTQ